jgi:hypothetical protein
MGLIVICYSLLVICKSGCLFSQGVRNFFLKTLTKIVDCVQYRGWKPLPHRTINCGSGILPRYVNALIHF